VFIDTHSEANNTSQHWLTCNRCAHLCAHFLQPRQPRQSSYPPSLKAVFSSSP